MHGRGDAGAWSDGGTTGADNTDRVRPKRRVRTAEKSDRLWKFWNVDEAAQRPGRDPTILNDIDRLSIALQSADAAGHRAAHTNGSFNPRDGT